MNNWWQLFWMIVGAISFVWLFPGLGNFSGIFGAVIGGGGWIAYRIWREFWDF